MTASTSAPRVRTDWTTAALGLPAALTVAALLVVPIGYLFQFSLHHGVPGRMAVTPGLTLANYSRLLLDSFYLSIIARTLGLALLVTVICLVLGFPLAQFLWRAPPRWKNLLTLLVVAPLLISIVTRAYGWMIILGDAGIVNDALRRIGLVDHPLQIMFTTGAVLIGLVHVQLPFMVLSILASLERIDPALMDAAATLGANRWRTALTVLVPLAAPGIVGGSTLVFSLCMTAFVTPTLLGGSGAKVLTTLAYHQFVTVFDWPFGAAIAAVLFGLSAGLIALFLRGVRRWTDRLAAAR
jgi:putative spermidine/putrescine transport system permease protein